MINEINGVVSSYKPLQLENQAVEQVTKQSFANVLKTTLDKVSLIENAADKKTDLLVQGKITDLHDVMITAEKAKITVETAVQVQQKMIDTYNEMMRMQV